MAAKDGTKPTRPIVIRREEVVQGGHHGGAWKVAYADFVTAMMAFFLLMWLLNATTEAQRKGLADYFSPSNVLSHNSSGTGKPFGGKSPLEDGHELSDKGALAVIHGSAQAPPDSADADSDESVQDAPARPEFAPDGINPDHADRSGDKHLGGGQATRAATTPARADYLAQAASGSATPDPARIGNAALRAELDRRERASFEQAAQAIRDAVAADPALAELARQLAIDMTPEGLRIQLLDADKEPMFPTGSSNFSERARRLLTKVAGVLAKLPQQVSIAGHTDAAPYRGTDRTNWELSSEWANATRRLLVDGGLDEGRFRSVTGNADRDPLLPADPLAAANRRIAIVVLRARR